LLAPAYGCGADACAEAEPDESDDAPEVSSVKLLEDAVPGDPWEIVFVTTFRDTDGDLGTGLAHVYLNGEPEPAIELPMRDVFRQSALALDATSGKVTVPLRFADTVPDGSEVRMGLMVVDAAGHESNCYRIDLEFEVKRISRFTRDIYQRLAALFSRYDDGA
jgi:hypothetical protein